MPVGCGECVECRKKKAREWQIRLSEEIKTDNKGIFVTLTFSNEKFKEYAMESEKKGYELDNEIATKATRHFLERWRKKYKRSVKHWLVTELGHNGTENIHMHGIIFTDKEPNEIREIWKNGWVWLGNQKGDGTITNYVTEKTVNYIIKYISKMDNNHQGYKSKILSSKGIGKKYIERSDAKKNKYKEVETNESYRFNNGSRTQLPMYYRNKIYSEEEREKLWLQKLDKNERWVMGQRIDISETEDEYNKLVEECRRKNEWLGYGNGKHSYDEIKYQNDRRNLLHKKRMGIIEADEQESGHDSLRAVEGIYGEAMEKLWQQEYTEQK